MKKVIVMFSLFCFVFLFSACSNKDDKSASSGKSIEVEKLASVDVGKDKISLRYKFEKGETFKLKYTTVSSSNETIQADSTMKNKISQSLTYVFDCEVLDVDEENIAELSMMISDIKVNIDVNGQKAAYTSGMKYPEADKPKYMEYETLYRTPYRARVTPKGEVIEVSRLEKMVDKMNSLSPQKMDLTTEQKAGYAKQFAESAIRPMTQQVFRELPSDAVNKTYSWEKRFPQSMGSLTVENIAKYTVVDFVEVDGNNTAKISAALSSNVSGNKKGTENGVDYTFGDPKISGDGTILFDYESGKLIKADVGTNSDMSISIEAKDSLGKIKKSKRITSTKTRNTVELI